MLSAVMVYRRDFKNDSAASDEAKILRARVAHEMRNSFGIAGKPDATETRMGATTSFSTRGAITNRFHLTSNSAAKGGPILDSQR